MFIYTRYQNAAGLPNILAIAHPTFNLVNHTGLCAVSYLAVGANHAVLRNTFAIVEPVPYQLTFDVAARNTDKNDIVLKLSTN